MEQKQNSLQVLAVVLSVVAFLAVSAGGFVFLRILNEHKERLNRAEENLKAFESAWNTYVGPYTGDFQVLNQILRNSQPQQPPQTQ